MMEAVFIKVLNMSISAGWLILAVMLLRLLLKKAPKWISVVLWGLVGLRLVFPFSLQSVLSLIPSAEVISPSIGYAQHPEINSGVSVIDNAVNPTLGTSLAATPMNSVNPMQIVLYLGGLVWVGGIVILLLYGLISYLRLRRKVTEAIPYEKNTWLCDQVKTPFILGVFRPRIYLPSGLNEKETAYVLAHERAHLKRKDHLWKPLGFLLLTVYWFNPLVWVAYILLCRDIEAACDEKVISDMAMAEKKAYANALVSCSMQRRLILACPLAFGEVGVKERVKGVLNYRKPAFWIIVAALIACAVIAVCFLTNPKDDGPDLSFLNYKNAITLIGQNDTAPYANLYPADSDGVQLGVADAKALAQFLGSAEWTKRRAPSSSPEPRGYLEFVIEDDYRIIVYQTERLAAVRFGNDIRYYRTGAGDYEAALATFIPAPSTEPDRRPEQTFDTELILSDPLSFLLSFSNAEIVTLIDNTGHSYEKSGKSFHEIISSQTWTAQAIQGFTTVEPSRQIYLRGDDYWCLSFEQTAPDSEMTCCAHNLLSSQSMLISFDCGENLMDELMAWAVARQQESSAGIDLTDPEAVLLSFSNAQVVTVIDETDRSYENTGRNFAEIVSAQTWSAHQTEGFPASYPDRLIVMIHGDWELRIEEATGECLYMVFPKDSDANSLVTYLDCGKNLMDELMPWALLWAGEPKVASGDAFVPITLSYEGYDINPLTEYQASDPDLIRKVWDLVNPAAAEPVSEGSTWQIALYLTFRGESEAIRLHLFPDDLMLSYYTGENYRLPEGTYLRVLELLRPESVAEKDNLMLSVTSGNVTIEPYPVRRFSETWTEYGQLAADGLPIELELEEHANDIPTLRLDGELRVQMPEDTSALTFYLLDGLNGNQLISETLYNDKRLESPVVTRVSHLDGLAPGKYLCYFVFLRACISNETEGLFDRLGDNCYFWLEIPEQ